MSVGLPSSTTRGVCREIRFCSSAGKSNLCKTFCSDLRVCGEEVEVWDFSHWMRAQDWIRIFEGLGFGSSGAEQLELASCRCVCVCVSVSLSLPSLEIFPAHVQTGHSFRKFIAPLKERLLVTDLQSFFVEAGVAKDLCDRQTKLMLEAEQPIWMSGEMVACKCPGA